MDRRAALEAEIERAIAECDESAPAWIWGERDCLLFCADIVKRAIGVDPAEPYRGRYSSREGAAEVIGPKGLLWVSRRRARELGADPVKISKAEIGDWGVCLTPEGLASVVKYRGEYWIGCIDRGVALIKDVHVKAAWSFC
jgi:hypothetical protein